MMSTGPDAILDVAEGIFAESGFAGAKMKSVATEARVSLSTLYGAYGDKMRLYRAVHARRLADLMGEIRALPVPDDVVGGMLAGMRVYVRFHMEHPNYLRMHLREGMAWSGSDELLSPEQVEAWTRGVERMARAFERGMSAGVFVREDPVLCARTVNAMHQVALSHWVDGGMAEAPRELCARLARQFVRAFCLPSEVPKLLESLEREDVERESA